MRKKLFGVVLTAALLVVLIVAFLPVETQAAYSGMCGKNLTWTLSDDGTLTISGTGAMYNYTSNNAPWTNHYNMKVVIKNGVTTIGNFAFFGRNVTSVTIPESVTSIGESAFSNCSALTSIIIPDGVTSIGKYAFERCTRLNEITIPASMTRIGEYAFEYCTRLKTVYYRGQSQQWGSISIGRNGNEYLRNATLILDNCDHNWGSGKVTKQPTCKEEGVKTYTCTACGEIRTESVHRLTSHSYGDWYNISNSLHGRICSGCGKEETAVHAWDSGRVTKQPTCGQDGVKAYTCTVCQGARTELIPGGSSAHNWNSGVVTTQPTSEREGTKTYTCTSCGVTKTETLPKLTTHTHTYSDWYNISSSLHGRICSGCGKEETAVHTWDSGRVTKQPSCKKDGVKTYTCSLCDATKNETVAKTTKHTYRNNCDPDCNECGATRTVSHNYKTSWSKDKSSHWHACSVCGDKVDKAAHKPGAPATTTTPQTCKVCGYELASATGTGEPTTPNGDDVTEPENNVDESQTQPGNNVDGDGTLPGNNDIGNGTESADTNDILAFALIIAMVASIIVGLLIFDRKKRK